MLSIAEKELEKMGLALPDSSAPGSNYIPYKQAGSIVFFSGQICKWNGELKYRGAVDNDVTLDQAVKGAEICALNLLYQVKEACNGNLDRVRNCLNISVYINSGTDFNDHAAIANGATNIITKCFGEKGHHTRAAIGCSSLPGGSTVEITGIFELDEKV